MISKLALATLLPALAAALPCVQFDASRNLYAFGGEQDVSLGASSAWSSPSPKPLSSEGRPPWNGNYSQCLLSQNSNAMYVLGADSSDASWSKQVTTGAPDVLQNSRSASILDHNTNVIYTVGPANMVSLDFGAVTNTAAGALAWQVVGTPQIASQNYRVTAAAASNHINYYGVPGTPAGSTNMFVVHYSYWQPQPAAYTAVGGRNFPAQSGQAVSLLTPNSTLPPYQNLFVPDDFSGAYIVTHYTADWSWNDTRSAPMAVNLINSTQALPAPTAQDKEASYACSDTDCVQIDTQGNIYYINAVGKDYTIAPGATWQKLDYTLKPYVAPTTSSGPNALSAPTGTGNAAASSGASQASATPAGNSGAQSTHRGGVLGAMLAVAALAIASIA
ncbi:hypothetical protein CC85DRAFT_283117 [Cutaneotrichosporon oleaginosum]|uniref:Uncharacterized protein n=1 Tax=Cutaneotrichosporon oleaginosum TaxID=879819 RepID=A0A0J1BA81_9TREE|nr:uncharacterized protein CC85DRAFT_283117 [Cutaneotrichosporon oleaginosum]KLT44824.1 hypothetical protein CC85DRAFT_283117 [Cutaneotrichosporon oleaginosum]TXT11963.1 hypothetical protein COLE_02373 [Cutaneotrichosporon oleaginosum]